MSQVHPTAVLTGPVELAEQVTVGPLAVIQARPDAPVRIGRGTRLLGRCWLEGPLEIGSGNIIYPEATLGLAPQDRKWDPNNPGAGLRVGDRNVFREGVTIHRATSAERPSWIGDDNYFMAHSHAGHDVRIGNGCTFANGTLFGGHAEVGDRVVTGGHVAIHQFVRIGRLCMLTGLAASSKDLPPFFMLTAINFAGALNIVGMRRAGLTPEEIDDVRWAQRTLYASGRSMQEARSILAERAERPRVRELIEFISAAKRPICHGRGSTLRGTKRMEVADA
jgi:UDP-N-acetylglucosamine acyltransferase